LNIPKLTKALRQLWKRQVDRDEPRSQDGRDADECILVVARMLEGKSPDKAFGAPGDWGYGTPIGDALAALPDPVKVGVGHAKSAPDEPRVVERRLAIAVAALQHVACGGEAHRARAQTALSMITGNGGGK
jgi:hypothetical protein